MAQRRTAGERGALRRVQSSLGEVPDTVGCDAGPGGRTSDGAPIVPVQTQTEFGTDLAREVMDRVQLRLPGVAEARVRQEVALVLEQYAGSRVRAFLPILVERQVTARLAVPHV